MLASEMLLFFESKYTSGNTPEYNPKLFLVFPFGN
jgi:hypothetical protein